MLFAIGTGCDPEDFNPISGEVSPSNGTYTLAAGTYYISLASNKTDENYNTVPVSGTITVAKATA